jgi:hypothetical protein
MLYITSLTHKESIRNSSISCSSSSDRNIIITKKITMLIIMKNTNIFIPARKKGISLGGFDLRPRRACKLLSAIKLVYIFGT